MREQNGRKGRGSGLEKIGKEREVRVRKK